MAPQVLTGSFVLLASPLALAPFAGAFAPTPTPRQQDRAPGTAQLEEVIDNVQNQALGTGTVADLALPEDLLRRLSDRILRRSFEDNFRIVVDVASKPGTAAPAVAATAGDAAPASAPATAPETVERSPFRTVLDLLAIGAVAVLAFLGYFAWRARARRRE